MLPLSSVGPSNYDDALTEGIRLVLSLIRGEDIPRGTLFLKKGVKFIRMATNVATRAS